MELIEGNIVVDPDGRIVNVIRANRGRWPDRSMIDKAYLLRVTEDGTAVSFDSERDLMNFPGGGAKFTIRWDDVSGRYYSLVNPQDEPNVWRNVLSLSSSVDLRNWVVDREVLRHPEPERHAFQYVDWVFDGDDMLFVSRTSYDDGMGGAHNAHDANFLTFHRIRDFRSGVE